MFCLFGLRGKEMLMRPRPRHLVPFSHTFGWLKSSREIACHFLKIVGYIRTTRFVCGDPAFIQHVLASRHVSMTCPRTTRRGLRNLGSPSNSHSLHLISVSAAASVVRSVVAAAVLWVALLVYERYLSNAASFAFCVFCGVKDHRNLLKY